MEPVHGHVPEGSLKILTQTGDVTHSPARSQMAMRDPKAKATTTKGKSLKGKTQHIVA
jgi:hypothetical protein